MDIFGSKKYLVGIETEYFVLDNNGKISNNSDVLIQKLLEEGIDAKKECARNMIELISKPTELISGATQNLLDKITTLIEIAEKNDMKIFNYGTYPDPFDPQMREDQAYKIKERIFGTKAWKIAGRCIGFHCHYTLISGIFDGFTKNIRLLLHLEKNQAFVDSYNVLIAIDPVFSTFMQSSPFYQGKFYGKDSRIMFYRGNKYFGINGLYTNFQEFGALPEYKNIVTEIMYLAESRFEKWHMLMKKTGINANPRKFYNSIYDINWSPVKVNPIGTFELRGMDMNRFELLMSCGAVMRDILKIVHERKIKIVIDEIGIEEPFKVEGKDLYLPPFNYVEGEIQKNSAIKGLENKTVLNYCKKFLKFVSGILPPERKRFLKPFKKILRSRNTMSDWIIKEARKMGVRNEINESVATELAIKITDKKLLQDIEKTRKLSI